MLGHIWSSIYTSSNTEKVCLLISPYLTLLWLQFLCSVHSRISWCVYCLYSLGRVVHSMLRVCTNFNRAFFLISCYQRALVQSESKCTELWVNLKASVTGVLVTNSGSVIAGYFMQCVSLWYMIYVHMSRLPMFLYFHFMNFFPLHVCHLLCLASLLLLAVIFIVVAVKNIIFCLLSTVVIGIINRCLKEIMYKSHLCAYYCVDVHQCLGLMCPRNNTYNLIHNQETFFPKSSVMHKCKIWKCSRITVNGIAKYYVGIYTKCIKNSLKCIQKIAKGRKGTRVLHLNLISLCVLIGQTNKTFPLTW